jgi:flagellar biosynthesis GTPase FlhF
MNKIFIIITIVIVVLSLILYKSVSVFELMVNDAKNNPKKFEKFLNKEQKQQIEHLTQLEEELEKQEEELAGKQEELEEEMKKAVEEEESRSKGESSEEEESRSKGESSEEENSVESFTNQNMTCPQSIFGSPCAVNTPISDDAIPETYTGGNFNSYMPLNPTEGNYCLPIQKFQYDGVWNNNVVQLGNGYQMNNWSIPSDQPVIESQYCTNNFINIPDNVLIPGTKIYDSTIPSSVPSDYVMQCC